MQKSVGKLSVDARQGLSLHLVSDLDGIWLPAAGRKSDLERLEAFLGRHPGIVLSFATGRTLDSALSALSGMAERLPRYLVTDVGTAIYQRDAHGRWVELEDYARWVERRWDRPAVARAVLGALPGHVAPQSGVAPPRRLPLELTVEGAVAASRGLAPLRDFS